MPARLYREIAHPSQVDNTFVVTKKIRYYTAAAGTYVISSTNLLCAMSVGKTLNTTVNALCYSTKVRQIEIFGGPAAVAAQGTVGVYWFGGTWGTDAYISDSSCSTAEPAHVVTRPPQKSSADFWINADNFVAAVFSIELTAGSIVDLTLDLRFNNATTIATMAVTTCTVGVLYYMPLDGSGTHSIAPINLLSTF